MLFTFAYEAAGAPTHPAFPAPSVIRGHKFLHDSGALRREKANVCSCGCLKFEKQIGERQHPTMPRLNRLASGALGEIRTPDPRNRNPMLYPAELRARLSFQWVNGRPISWAATGHRKRRPKNNFGWPPITDLPDRG